MQQDSRAAYGLRFLLVRSCILVYMVHETNFIHPVLAMTCGLDVHLWVGLMEIKGHFVS